MVSKSLDSLLSKAGVVAPPRWCGAVRCAVVSVSGDGKHVTNRAPSEYASELHTVGMQEWSYAHVHTWSIRNTEVDSGFHVEEIFRRSFFRHSMGEGRCHAFTTTSLRREKTMKLAITALLAGSERPPRPSIWLSRMSLVLRCVRQ